MGGGPGFPSSLRTARTALRRWLLAFRCSARISAWLCHSLKHTFPGPGPGPGPHTFRVPTGSRVSVGRGRPCGDGCEPALLQTPRRASYLSRGACRRLAKASRWTRNAFGVDGLGRGGGEGGVGGGLPAAGAGSRQDVTRTESDAPVLERRHALNAAIGARMWATGDRGLPTWPSLGWRSEPQRSGPAQDPPATLRRPRVESSRTRLNNASGARQEKRLLGCAGARKAIRGA